MRHVAMCLASAFLLAGCTTPSDRQSVDERFSRLTDEFLATTFAGNPPAGVALGWHQYDGRFVVPDAPALAGEIARLKRFDAAFAAIRPAQLRPNLRNDLAVLRSTIAGQRWALEGQRGPWRNPMFYAGALDVSIYLKRDFKPLADRVRDITSILRHAPALFDAARANLESTLPKASVETAIDVAEGTASFIEADVTKAASGVSDAVVQSEFTAASRTAVEAIRGYVAWLKATRLPAADGSFAVGRKEYIRMLQAERIDLTPEQVLEIGMRELRAEQGRFAAAAAVIDSTRSPLEVFKSIQREHPTAAGLLPDTRRNLEGIRQFLIDRHIVTVPSEVRARVEETLPPFRSTSFASMDTPGPFETKATEAYYYVTPVEANWTAAQAEEWLSAFNYYALDVTSIHEAYPGHYLQFLALNASRASVVGKVFSSYPFVEGWAHYTEQMMMEEGFALPPNVQAATREEQVRAAKYRLDQSDEALLRLCRLCCSVKLHTQGMTVDQATRFFMDNCYFEEKPARSEAMRGTFDPGYLYYSLGKLMILKLREDWKAQEGTAYSLQRFHDEFLSHGAPPIRLLREIMLRDSKQWGRVLAGDRP